MPVPRLARYWDVLAGAASGILQGFANIGGPPLMMWVCAHQWSNQQFRITPVSIALLMVPFQLVILAMIFTFEWARIAMWSVWAIPSVIVGTLLGLAIGGRLAVPNLRKLAFCLLLIICLTAILSPLLRGA